MVCGPICVRAFLRDNGTVVADFDVPVVVLYGLPLPLAQLHRRARNAIHAQERHLAAYYLGEVAIKLLGSVAVATYAERDEHDPALAERLQALARPSLGHWWEFVRRLTPVLAEDGDEGFAAVRDVLLGRSRDDMPFAAALDVALIETLEDRQVKRTAVRATELFDRLVRYRNREIGHGAAGQRPAAFYEKMSPAMLTGLTEALGRIDPLAGRSLVWIADVRRRSSGDWLVELFDLTGESPRRIESRDVPEDRPDLLPRPERVYLQRGEKLVSLHPLVLFENEGAETFFLNARRGGTQAEYLCYSTGRTVKRASLAGEHRELLARVLDAPVDEESVDVWAAQTACQDEPGNEVPLLVLSTSVGTKGNTETEAVATVVGRAPAAFRRPVVR